MTRLTARALRRGVTALSALVLSIPPAVALNSSAKTVEELNDVPIKVVNSAMVYVRDVAQVRDGFNPQTNIVRMDGQRGALITIMKSGFASTLDVVRLAGAFGIPMEEIGHRTCVRSCTRRRNRQ